MAMENFSRHQQGIIKRYYSNQDTIQLQKLGELVTELYLAEGKKRAKLWQTAANSLTKMGIAVARVELLVSQDKPELLAQLVKEMQTG